MKDGSREMGEGEITGGRCLCGAVRYEFEGAPNWAGHCSCESCRRAASAPITSYFGVSNERWRWTGAEPSIYASSPGVERLFCGRCGSPLAYRNERRAHETDFHAMTLERPEAFRPEFHVFTAEAVDWLPVADGLPRWPGTKG